MNQNLGYVTFAEKGEKQKQQTPPRTDTGVLISGQEHARGAADLQYSNKKKKECPWRAGDDQKSPVLDAKGPPYNNRNLACLRDPA